MKKETDNHLSPDIIEHKKKTKVCGFRNPELCQVQKCGGVKSLKNVIESKPSLLDHWIANDGNIYKCINNLNRFASTQRDHISQT